MTDERPLRPSEFTAVCRDYSSSEIEDETYLKRCYASQITVTQMETRDPLSPHEAIAALIAHAGVDVDLHGRDRLELVYSQQIRIARDFAGGGRE
ncbi:hypothetical protein [Haloarcula rubripromontorii]|uniref:hypothetical protein n=1 Tax=Haloarcula rubripromontorii TaxID=1705562 RepID=UPI00345C5056